MIILTGKAVCVCCGEAYNIQDSDAWSPALYCAGECEAIDESCEDMEEGELDEDSE